MNEFNVCQVVVEEGAEGLFQVHGGAEVQLAEVQEEEVLLLEDLLNRQD